jgi:hypothetical protein
MTIKMQLSVDKCITAGRSEEPNTIVAFEKLRNRLEQCLLHWLEHVKTMRDEFDLLHDVTVDKFADRVDHIQR